MITHTDDPRLLWYVAGWIGFCLVGVGILVNDRERVWDELQRYRAYLTMPWKLAIFLPAFLFVTFAGRFTDDETWDVITGGWDVSTYLSHCALVPGHGLSGADWPASSTIPSRRRRTDVVFEQLVLRWLLTSAGWQLHDPLVE